MAFHGLMSYSQGEHCGVVTFPEGTVICILEESIHYKKSDAAVDMVWNICQNRDPASVISTESIDSVTVTFFTEQGINGINETKLF